MKEVILREWRAEVRRELAEEYVEYVNRTGIAAYRSVAGNLSAGVGIRPIDDTRSEVVTVSTWTSMDAIRTFAGDDPERARYFPEDDRYLLTRPDGVTHHRFFPGE